MIFSSVLLFVFFNSQDFWFLVILIERTFYAIIFTGPFHSEISASSLNQFLVMGKVAVGPLVASAEAACAVEALMVPHQMRISCWQANECRTVEL